MTPTREELIEALAKKMSAAHKSETGYFDDKKDEATIAVDEMVLPISKAFVDARLTTLALSKQLEIKPVLSDAVEIVRFSIDVLDNLTEGS